MKPPDVPNNAIHCEGKKQIRHLSQMLCGKVNLIFVCGLTWAVKRDPTFLRSWPYTDIQSMKSSL